jgi:hypothetical protein
MPIISTQLAGKARAQEALRGAFPADFRAFGSMAAGYAGKPDETTASICRSPLS